MLSLSVPMMVNNPEDEGQAIEMDVVDPAKPPTAGEADQPAGQQEQDLEKNEETKPLDSSRSQHSQRSHHSSQPPDSPKSGDAPPVQDEVYEIPSGGHSIFAGIFNFVNSIVGAGIIGLAFSFNEAGLWLGLILLLVCGALTDYSVGLIVRVGNYVNQHTYEGVCFFLMGKIGFYVVALSMFIFAFGAMIAYFVIIGDTIPVILDSYLNPTSHPREWVQYTLGNRQIMIVVCAFTICLPLASFKDIGKLSKTSFISIAAVLVICLFVAIWAPFTAQSEHMHTIREPKPDPKSGIREFVNKGVWAFAHDHPFQAFGGICFAYVCHHSSFLVRNSMKEPNKWPLVTHTSIIIATILSLLMALSGYISFERCTRGNILNNFLHSNLFANLSRILLAVTMFLTYPMEFFVARQAAYAIYLQISRPPRADGKPHDTNPVNMPGKIHWLITGILFAVTLVAGAFIPQDKLSMILEFSGGAAATLLGFMLPAGAWLMYQRKIKKEVSIGDTVGSIILLLVGGAAFCTAMYFAVAKIVHDPHDVPSPTCPCTGTENSKPYYCHCYPELNYTHDIPHCVSILKLEKFHTAVFGPDNSTLLAETVSTEGVSWWGGWHHP
eukprot:TRINITY_DN35573_c0_g1_i1.p1 TRINITY_DN35573_c0_g1~~TRINITY_DN35573_c0_g1_i1.p1  ORF type:complete len:609 (-),score=51.78 TRINITY_DN35573_c0_g1_i1:79-1905(-)